MRVARTTLGAGGIALIGVGAFEAVQLLDLGQLVGLAVWLAAAVVLHDGVVAPATALVSHALERRGSALAPAARGVLRVGLVVGALLTLVVVPEVVARARGNPNPTVLQGPYAVRLAWTWVAIGVLTAVGTAVAQRLDASARARDGGPRRPTVRGS
jgi:hypothetical protein